MNLKLAELKAKPLLRKALVTEAFINMQNKISDDLQTIQNRQLVPVTDLKKLREGYKYQTQNCSHYFQKVATSYTLWSFGAKIKTGKMSELRKLIK